ncbi:MAG TPA: hypothetical protein VFH55_05850 [Nitrospiria bacterium]|nr:hypothetical protein [Nitrospiria bacterium]
MKRILSSLVMGVVVLSFVGMSWAGMISGDLTKIDEKGSFYFVKDKKGKEHKIHFDNTTQKTGEVKVGDMVEVDVAKGHAKSIKVAEKK